MWELLRNGYCKLGAEVEHCFAKDVARRGTVVRHCFAMYIARIDSGCSALLRE